jgi:Fe-Mn family superoxide dismutase
MSLFGNGWIWLVQRADGLLEIVSTSGAGNPLATEVTPLLVMDMWEHAYFLGKLPSP